MVGYSIRSASAMLYNTQTNNTKLYNVLRDNGRLQYKFSLCNAHITHKRIKTAPRQRYTKQNPQKKKLYNAL